MSLIKEIVNNPNKKLRIDCVNDNKLLRYIIYVNCEQKTTWLRRDYNGKRCLKGRKFNVVIDVFERYSAPVDIYDGNLCDESFVISEKYITYLILTNDLSIFYNKLNLPSFDPLSEQIVYRGDRTK